MLNPLVSDPALWKFFQQVRDRAWRELGVWLGQGRQGFYLVQRPSDATMQRIDPLRSARRSTP